MHLTTSSLLANFYFDLSQNLFIGNMLRELGGQEVTESPKGGSAWTSHHHPPDRSPQKILY